MFENGVPVRQFANYNTSAFLELQQQLRGEMDMGVPALSSGGKGGEKSDEYEYMEK